ncbi:DsbA family protein [Thalassorhabdomicrobium marinisediminis]|uniref:DsbA family protein n=1 Tax=Thalassorhabdomicrobium marinisediminis TaxID=2170577 RepID=UPI002490A38B|nr:DsbA family protein [Thalassorhabdomicrobium marinisediminis]
MRILLTLTALALSTTLAQAQAADPMSDAEREAFRSEVRAYLLEHPEVLMEAIGVLETRQQEAEVMRDEHLAQANAEALTNDGFSHVGGNPDGDITIVEFVDYKCGYCRRAHPEVAELIESDGNIRIITKEFPILGEQSVLASRFAIATKLTAGDEAYKQVSDGLMTMRADVTEASLTDLAKGFDLDADAILAAMERDEVQDIIAANRALGQRMQITGTPTFVFDDQMVRGYVPLAQMRQIVEAERNDG